MGYADSGNIVTWIVVSGTEKLNLIAVILVLLLIYNVWSDRRLRARQHAEDTG
jgi:uncharacterized membrane protein